MSSPGNGFVPVSISNRTAPKAHMSVRLSTRLPLACSGLIYAAVPRITPTLVASRVRVGDIELSVSGVSSWKTFAKP